MSKNQIISNLDAAFVVDANNMPIALTALDGGNLSNIIASNASYAASAGVADSANSVAGANVSGAVANATYAVSSGTADSATVAASANSVAGGNVVGEVANAAYATNAGNATYSANANYANVAGEVTGSAQANITTLGNLLHIDFDQTSTSPVQDGRMVWNSGEGTVDLGLADDVTLNIGTQEYARVYNAEATTLVKGEIVYIFGAQGNRVSVKRAQANTESTSFGTLGMVTANIASGDEGFVTVSGAVYKLNTSAVIAGAAVYLSPSVAGGYTTTKPVAPDQLVVIGWVERVDATVGSIYIKVDNGYELDELHDVFISNVQSGQSLVYNGNLWVNGVAAYANTANSVALANVSGAGNIASLNLDGSSSNVLYGNGVFAPAAGGSSNAIVNGTSNVRIDAANGNIDFAANGASVGILSRSGTNSQILFGVSATTSNINTITIGSGSNTSGFRSVAIGINSFASGYESTALGSYARAEANNAVAVGEGRALAESAISIGQSSRADSNHSVAIGSSAKANLSPFSISIGRNPTVRDSNNCIAIGYNTTIEEATDSVAIGNTAYVLGEVGAIGASYAIGSNARVENANGSYAIGNGAYISYGYDNSFAIGTNASAQGSNYIALGTSDYTVDIPGILQTSDVANVRIPNGTAGQFLQTDGAGNLSWATAGGGGGGTPAGNSGEIQFNSNGAFSATNSLTYTDDYFGFGPAITMSNGAASSVSGPILMFVNDGTGNSAGIRPTEIGITNGPSYASIKADNINLSQGNVTFSRNNPNIGGIANIDSYGNMGLFFGDKALTFNHANGTQNSPAPFVNSGGTLNGQGIIWKSLLSDNRSVPFASINTRVQNTVDNANVVAQTGAFFFQIGAAMDTAANIYNRREFLAVIPSANGTQSSVPGRFSQSRYIANAAINTGSVVADQYFTKARGYSPSTYSANGTATLSTANTYPLQVNDIAFRQQIQAYSGNGTANDNYAQSGYVQVGTMQWSITDLPIANNALFGSEWRVQTGNASANTVRSMTFSNVGLLSTPSLAINTGTPPATASSTGTTGQIAWDASYIYVCTATNTWVRAALSTW